VGKLVSVASIQEGREGGREGNGEHGPYCGKDTMYCVVRAGDWKRKGVLLQGGGKAGRRDRKNETEEGDERA